MKTLCSLLCMLGLSVMIISCQTGVTGDLPAPPTPPGSGASDSTYLSEWIILDTTYPSGVDTSDKYWLFYDANKRLSKFVYEDYKLGLPAATRLYQHSECTFTYTGADTVPSRTIDIYSFTDDPTRSIIKDTTYYFYKNGMVSKDSLLVPNRGNDYLSNEFTYLGGDRYHVRSVSYGNNQFYSDDSGYSHVNWQNDLLLSSQDSTKRDGFPWFASPVRQITYDNKPNPFKRLLLPYPAPLTYSPYDNWLHDWYFLPTRNNITSYSVTGFPPITYAYEYRANGLPSVCRFDDGNNSYAKMIFKYTKL
jgi:hypothetical protein